MAWKLTPEADAEIMKWFREQTRREYRMKNYNDILGDILEDIFRNNQEFNKGKERIRADEDLSTQGKNAALARLYEHHSKKHQELKEKLEKERESLKRELSRAVFAPSPKDIPAFNAAMDRLESIKHQDELDTLINRADKIGDSITLQAIALHAAERGYGNILGRVRRLLPDRAESLDLLSDFQARWGDARSKGTILEERIYSSGPQKPEGVPDTDLVEGE
jgi:hypothetical protein